MKIKVKNTEHNTKYIHSIKKKKKEIRIRNENKNKTLTCGQRAVDPGPTPAAL